MMTNPLPWNRIEAKNSEPILRTAERLLKESLFAEVQIAAWECVPGFEHVARCRTVIADGVAGPNVIIKIPQRADRLPRQMNHAAGLEFLNTLPAQKRLWPVLYGIDAELGLVIAEDLGRNTVTTVLASTDRQAAEEALLQLAATTGQTQAMTRGRYKEYQQIRSRYGPLEDAVNFDHAQFLASAWADLAASLACLDLPVTHGLSCDYQALIEALSNPSPFLTYSGFDSSPDNCVLTRDQVKLFDFDWGAFRNALTDGVFGWTMYTYPTVFAIPEGLLQRIEDVYRRHLAMAFPEANEDYLFYKAAIEACAYWLLFYTISHLKRLLQGQFAPNFVWPKQQIIKMAQAFLSLTERHTYLGHLREIVMRLQERYYQIWSADDLKINYFPALT